MRGIWGGLDVSPCITDLYVDFHVPQTPPTPTGHDRHQDGAAEAGSATPRSPPFKLVNAASLRALCTCGGGGSGRPCVCRWHLSDYRKWAYHAPTQVRWSAD